VQQLSGRDRLIVALDVPTHARALELVDQLDNVFFFKIGLELFFAGDVLGPDGFLQRLQDRRAGGGEVFVDLKTGGDIGNTIASMIGQLQRLNVKFLTFLETVPRTIMLNSVKAVRAARGSAQYPQVLMVPCLSTMDEEDLRASGINMDVNEYIVQRAKVMIDAGCDGLIVSGQAIRLCRDALPSVVIASPGIRPAWASPNDHKRLTTPREAITLGANYLVVGRPITKASDPRDAAQRIIDEIDVAQKELNDRSTGPGFLSKTG
jgi:orotidine-5'-phosphate decarboxylase